MACCDDLSGQVPRRREGKLVLEPFFPHPSPKRQNVAGVVHDCHHVGDWHLEAEESLQRPLVGKQAAPETLHVRLLTESRAVRGRTDRKGTSTRHRSPLRA